MKPRISQLLKLRRFIRRNQHIGMRLKKSDYAYGWQVGHCDSQWTLWTIYVDQTGGFSFFHAIPDIAKGVDIEDEKLIIRTEDLGNFKCKWDGEWFRFIYGEPQRQIVERWESV